MDQHALETMYCHAGCDAVVNYAAPHAYSTYIKPTCSVQKDENQVEYKKYKSKDDKNDKSEKVRRALGPKRSESGQELATRDIDAYTVGSATFRFSCTDPHGNDYTEIVSSATWLLIVYVADRLLALADRILTHHR